MNSDKYEVTIYLYDISNGMAKSFSPMFLGKCIEGIWHTGLVVYGTEYYYGGGICQGVPKYTPYGTPVKELKMSMTEIPKELFDTFLEEINDRYHIGTYDFLNNNCNHFTHEILNFLTGEGLPDSVLKQHDEIKGTALGNMILPMLENMNAQNNQFLPQMYEGKK